MTTDEQVRDGVRRVLGAIGNAALPATAFDDMETASAEPNSGESTRRRQAAVAVGLAAATIAGTAAIVVMRTDSDTVQTGTPPTLDGDRSSVPVSTAAVPASTGPASTVPATETSDAARRAATAAAEIDEPWYFIDLDAARPDRAAFMVPETIAGFSTSVWVSADGSYEQVIVIHSFTATEFATTLSGTNHIEITNPDDGRGFLVYDDADPMEEGGWRGNEFRWERDDGVVWEMHAFGLPAGEVVKNALIAMDAPDLASPQTANLPGFGLVGTTDGNRTMVTQSIALGDHVIRLTRNDGPPITTDGLTGAGTWTGVSRREVAGHEAIVAVLGDTANAIWRTGTGQSFTLAAIPVGRLDEVLDAVTWLDPTGDSPTPANNTPVSTPPESTAAGPSAEAFVRPVVDTSYCTPFRADEWSDTEHTLFTRSSSLPIPVQIIGDPSADITAPYAVVERFFTDQRPPNFGEFHDVNGQEARVSVGEDGGGQVGWLLPDGTEAYIRSRGWDSDELLQLARALSPRAADAAVPGFDITGALPDGATLIGETADPLVGSGANSTCQLDGIGGHLTVAVVRGDIPYTFGVNVDWSPRPIVVQRGDAVLGIAAPAHAPASAIDDVTNATAEEWEALLRSSEFQGVPPDAPTSTEPS